MQCWEKFRILLHISITVSESFYKKVLDEILTASMGPALIFCGLILFPCKCQQIGSRLDLKKYHLEVSLKLLPVSMYPDVGICAVDRVQRATAYML